MQIFAFLLIGGIWAAFLLPSFFENRRRTPLSTTRSFAKSKDLLASVSGVNAAGVKARRLSAARRRRAMGLLGAAAVASLAIAVIRGSLAWLGLTIVFDLALAAYITLLLQVRTTKVRAAPVVSLVALETPEDAQHHTVRIVAG